MARRAGSLEGHDEYHMVTRHALGEHIGDEVFRLIFTRGSLLFWWIQASQPDGFWAVVVSCFCRKLSLNPSVDTYCSFLHASTCLPSLLAWLKLCHAEG